MAEKVVDVLEEKTVVATLQPGPRGAVRLSYESPSSDQVRRLLEGLASPARMHAYVAPSVIEIDRAKLLELKFSQEELAEIGFSLVLRLSGMLRFDDV